MKDFAAPLQLSIETETIRDLTQNEIEDVNGALIPLALASSWNCATIIIVVGTMLM